MAVIVGFVPTKEGRAALQRAAQECLIRNAKLVVVSSSRGDREHGSREVQHFEEVLAQVHAELDERGVAHEMRDFARNNEPAEDLIAVADEVGADFIVIGLRRRTPVGKLLLGSNAQRILLEATCPVLAVKAPEGAE